MLPTMPSGHRGAPCSSDRIGAGATPSRARPRRAQCRTVANSRTRRSTASFTCSCSCGYSAASETSPNTSTTAAAPGRSDSITSGNLAVDAGSSRSRSPPELLEPRHAARPAAPPAAAPPLSSIAARIKVGTPVRSGEVRTVDADVIVVGGGLAGLVATAELAEAGRTVLLLDQEPEASLGGQAFWSFGGLFLIDSPEQRRMGVRDSRDLAWQDWLGSAGFDR